MNLEIGERVEIFCINYIFGALLFEDSKIPREQRRGVVINGAKDSSSYFNVLQGIRSMYDDPLKSSIIIALDNPLNIHPTQEDIKISNMYGVPGEGRNIIIITKEHKRLNFVKINRLRAPIQLAANSMVICPACDSIKRGAEMLVGCNYRHFFCAEHLIPWDRDLCRPAFSKCFELYRLLAQSSQIESSNPTNHMEVLSIVGSSYWNSCNDEGDRQRYIHGLVTNRLQVRCPTCNAFGNTRRECYLSMRLLEARIFPEERQRLYFRSEALAVSAAVSAAVLVCPGQASITTTLIAPSAPNIDQSPSNISGNFPDSHNSLHTQKLKETVRQNLKMLDIDEAVIDKLERENPSDCSAFDLQTALALVESLAGASNAIVLQRNYCLAPSTELTPRLMRDVDVSFVSPYGSVDGNAKYEVPQCATLTTGMSFHDIAMTGVRLVAMSLQSCPPEDLCLYFVKPKSKTGGGVSWREEVSATAAEQDDDQYALCIKSIKPESLLEIRSSKNNVGPLLYLKMLSADFSHNASMVAKVTKLNSAYIGFRRIRGDGNCYYRAVIFGLLEQIIESGQRARFHELHRCFSEYFAEYEFYMRGTNDTSSADAVCDPSNRDGQLEMALWQSQIKRFLQALQDAADHKIWQTVSDFEIEILREGPNGMDDAMIRACRRIVSSFLLKHKFTEVNGIVLSDAILPFFPGCSTMRAYCSEYVDRMGVDAEGPFVYLGVIFIALRCYGLTVLLDRREKVTLNFFETNPDSISCGAKDPNYNFGGCIHLLLRPGHYDLLRPSQANRPGGKSAFSVDDLRRLCGDPKAKLEKSYSTDTGPPFHGSTAAESADNLAYTQIRNMLHADYPSLVPVFEQFDASMDSILRLQCLSRVVLVCAYPPLRHRQGVLLHLDLDSPLPTAKALSLKGTDSEMMSHGRASFSIPVNYDLYLRPVPQLVAEDLEQFVICVRGVVTVQVDCRELDIISSVPRQASSSNVFTISLDLNVYNSLGSILALFIQILNLPPDCYFASSNLLDELWDLSEAQMIDPGNELTIKLSRGKYLYICNRNLDILTEFRMYSPFSFAELLHVIANKIGVDQPATMRIFRQFNNEITASFDCSKLDKKEQLKVLYCHCCSTSSVLDPLEIESVELIQLTNCEHNICSSCLSQWLQNSMQERRALDADHRPDAKPVMSLHKFHNVPNFPIHPDSQPSDFFPELIRTLVCPVPGCRGHLSDMDVGTIPIVGLDMAASYKEMEKYFGFLSSFRECCLQDATFCDPEPVESMLQLGCLHFFHKGCLTPYLRQQIDLSRSCSTASQLVCYECNKCKTNCNCPMCIERMDRIDRSNGAVIGHIYTELEVNELVRDGGFTLADKENWQRLTALITAKSMYTLMTCKQCGCTFNVDRAIEDRAELTCPQCEYSMCTKCQLRAHPQSTCAENAKRIRREEIELSGVHFIQDCPFCDTPWDVPINCLHVHCEGQDGCGRSFCFLCAASYTPTVVHGNWYHRPQCTFYNVQCDCDPPCLASDPLAVCVKSAYWPGPCSDCREAKSTNSCTHTSWKPCHSCVTKGIICSHWCDECYRKQSLCTPPGNPTDRNGLRFKVFQHEDVSNEQQRLAATPGIEHK